MCGKAEVRRFGSGGRRCTGRAAGPRGAFFCRRGRLASGMSRDETPAQLARAKDEVAVGSAECERACPRCGGHLEGGAVKGHVVVREEAAEQAADGLAGEESVRAGQGEDQLGGRKGGSKRLGCCGRAPTGRAAAAAGGGRACHHSTHAAPRRARCPPPPSTLSQHHRRAPCVAHRLAPPPPPWSPHAQTEGGAGPVRSCVLQSERRTRRTRSWPATPMATTGPTRPVAPDTGRT